MSLETEIKKLREAIEALPENLAKAIDFTSVTNVVGDVSTTKTEVKSNIQETPEDRKDPENPEPEETTEEVVEETSDELDDTPEESVVTTQDVKDLAKAKMAEGVLRADIKKIITGLGAESIADLDQDGLNKLHAKLTEM